MDFTPEEQEIIKRRRDALTAIYGAEMDTVTDAAIMAFTDEVYEQMLKKNEPQPITKADMEALYGVIERQGKAMDAFAERIKAQDQAIGAVSQNIEQVAQAVTPLMQAFAEFNKTDTAAPGGVAVQHNGNGGGKMDIMALLQNPLVQKFLGAGGGGEQVNPLQAVLSQVQFVAELKQNLDSIGGRGGGINHPKNGNWDRSDFLEGMRWAWRMKNGKMPAELLNAISEDNDDYGSPPRVIIIEKPAADAVRNRRESDEHKV